MGHRRRVWEKMAELKARGEGIYSPRMREEYYAHIHQGRFAGSRGGEHEPRWRGVRLSKMPQDLLLYAQTIFHRKPDYIIETGRRFGGSALFFGDLLLLAGGRSVFSVDISPNVNGMPPHPFVKYFNGDSTDPKLFNQIKNRVQERTPGSVMVILDSDHSTEHVTKELEMYSTLVTERQFIVVEDCWTSGKRPHGPYYAVNEWLKSNSNFVRQPVTDRFIFGITMDGWLERMK